MVIICCHGIPSPQASHQVPGLIKLFGSGFALALALIVAIALALALALIVAFTALAVAFCCRPLGWSAHLVHLCRGL